MGGFFIALNSVFKDMFERWLLLTRAIQQALQHKMWSNKAHMQPMMNPCQR